MLDLIVQKDGDYVRVSDGFTYHLFTAEQAQRFMSEIEDVTEQIINGE